MKRGASYIQELRYSSSQSKLLSYLRYVIIIDGVLCMCRLLFLGRGWNCFVATRDSKRRRSRDVACIIATLTTVVNWLYVVKWIMGDIRNTSGRYWYNITVDFLVYVTAKTCARSVSRFFFSFFCVSIDKCVNCLWVGCELLCVLRTCYEYIHSKYLLVAACRGRCADHM